MTGGSLDQSERGTLGRSGLKRERSPPFFRFRPNATVRSGLQKEGLKDTGALTERFRQRMSFPHISDKEA
ncbi:hypothetical protein MHYP_G00127570 [Metynnis hypsauchen]